MSLNDIFPQPDKFLPQEIYTLNRIKNNPVFEKLFKALATDAKDYLERNDKLIKAKSLKEIDFMTKIESIDVDGQCGAAYIGAIIKTRNNRYEHFSYDVAICNNKKIMRKFHFDYTPANIKKRAPHPIFHLQYPGELSSNLLALGLEHNHLDSSLSEPRMPFTPMSLALVINLIFKEFQNERTNQIIEDKTWRELIKTNEKQLLCLYYRKCNSFLSAPPADKLFTNDYCYGTV
jgi:hypothetical protein